MSFYPSQILYCLRNILISINPTTIKLHVLCMRVSLTQISPPNFPSIAPYFLRKILLLHQSQYSQQRWKSRGILQKLGTNITAHSNISVENSIISWRRETIQIQIQIINTKMKHFISRIDCLHFVCFLENYSKVSFIYQDSPVLHRSS